MLDEVFLGYCLIHCETERALFAAMHCRRLFAMAGEPFPEPDLPEGAFRAMRADVVKPLIEKARTRVRTTELYMQKGDKNLFWHDAPSPNVAKMYIPDWPVYKVRVVQRAAEEGASYWAWWDHEKQVFCFVWPRKFQVDMCFTYGPNAEEERGRGHVYAVDVEPLEKVLD